MNKLLREGRGLSDEQRFQMLVDLLSVDSDLPRPFRTKRGPATDWDEKNSEQWRRYLKLVDIHNIVFAQALPLPGGRNLSVDVEGDIRIDGLALPGPLPLRDIALWLSNPARVGRISDWPRFLIAMSCCMRKFSGQMMEDLPHWFRVNCWHGIDHRVFEEIQNLSIGHIQHPYLKFLNLTERLQFGDEVPRRELLEANLQLAQELGGVASEAWIPLLEDRDAMIRSAMKESIIPKLVVLNGRFCLLVIRDGKAIPLPIPVDVRIWRLLISWTMEPHDGLGQTHLNLLFWCWTSEQETWTLPSNKQKSIIFLREAVESLGADSSLTPVKVAGRAQGLRVAGRSGVHYLLLPTMDPRKYNVQAVPQESMLPDVMNRGLHLCIDSQAPHDIPPGDVAVSYLMSLHNDVDSKEQVHTLRCLLDLTKRFGNWKQRKTDYPCWWDELVENYTNEDPEYYEEEEDDWEEDYDYEDYPEHEEWDEEILSEEENEENRRITREVIAEEFRDLPPNRDEFRRTLETLYERFGGDPEALGG